METVDSKIIILAAAINVSYTPQIYYALITMQENGSSFALTNYLQIKHNTFFTGDPLADNLKMKLLLNRNVAYIYEEKFIYQIYLNGEENSLKIQPSDG